MSLSVSEKLGGLRDVISGRYVPDISSDLGRWQGQIYADWIDHGMLRRRWQNAAEFAPGVFRANHPNAAQLAQWKARGIVDVISLRGTKGVDHLFEKEACDALGLRLQTVSMSARSAPLRASLVRLLNLFEQLEEPALIHCKSGADRTGLAAALWHIHMEGQPVDQARRALNLRHLHVRWSKTGVLDRFLDLYQTRVAQGAIPLRQWVETEYDKSMLDPRPS